MIHNRSVHTLGLANADILDEGTIAMAELLEDKSVRWKVYNYGSTWRIYDLGSKQGFSCPGDVAKDIIANGRGSLVVGKNSGTTLALVGKIGTPLAGVG